MAFSDLKQLEEHLTTRSYIDGYVPSLALWNGLTSYPRYEPTQSDVGVYKSLGKAPDATQYPHAARWYSHITSWEAEHEHLPGDKEAGTKLFGGAASSALAAPAKAAEGDDEDIDLFGSDDEEGDAEAERIKAERVAEYNKKKAGKAKVAAKVRSTNSRQKAHPAEVSGFPSVRRDPRC